MSKFIKNTTTVLKTYSGKDVPAGSYIEIEPIQETNIVFNSDLEIDIASGELVAARDASGNTDITDPDKGIRFLQGVLNIKDGGISALSGVEEVDFQGDVEVTVEDKKATITIGGSDSMVGNCWHMTFSENNTVRDKWLNVGQDSVISNRTFGVVVWKSKLVGISWSNREDGADVDIKLYCSSEGDGNSPKIKAHEWAIRNCRVGRKTNISPDVIVEPGDKLACFVSDQGTNAKNVIITYYFKVVEDNSEESCEDFSGDFSLSGGSATTS